MFRHRASEPAANEDDSSSSSDKEDAFAAFSTKKRKKQKQTTKKGGPTGLKVVKLEASSSTEESTSIADADNKPKHTVLPVANTSSTKRHHGATSDTRQARMDAILLELEAEKSRVHHHPSGSETSAARGGHTTARKKGSFVDDGDEHITTNIFVGNLAPSITEEQMTELFRQFGENDRMKISDDGGASLWAIV